MRYEPNELINPRSAISDGVPVLRETLHWWLDMWKVSEVLRVWIQGKKGMWRTPVFSEVINTVLPSLRFDNIHEAKYKEIKSIAPAAQEQVRAWKEGHAAVREQGGSDACAMRIFRSSGIPSELVDGWAHRSITRDIAWGIPLPSTLIRTWRARRSTSGRIR